MDKKVHKQSLIPVIIAGGTGSRLWPLSRELYPKQFLKLCGEETLLQSTIERLKSLECQSPIVISNEKHRFIVAEQLRAINKLSNNIILEPCGRNTAPAIALAAFSALKNNNDTNPLLLVLAADHTIENEKSFIASINDAVKIAAQGKIVTFGIVPRHAETGYGYIHRGAGVCTETKTLEHCAFDVKEFVEKPSKEKAEYYLKTGEYYWNSGMFLFEAQTYLNELKKYRPDIYNCCEAAFLNCTHDFDFIRIPEGVFSNCPSESIDYAVMEQTKDCVVVPIDIGWNDIGSWQSLWEISPKTEEGNVHKGDVLSVNAHNNYVYSDSALVATVGVSDIVIVQTKDAVLVSSKNSVQDVKKIVEQLTMLERSEHVTHREVYTPWGKYDSIDQGDRYKVKKIVVKPGEGLSLRMHYHRSEHWIVVSGTANVTIGDNNKIIVANESVYIPQGALYSLENPGVIPLHLIEVSSGDYLGDDDIIRQKERYNLDSNQ